MKKIQKKIEELINLLEAEIEKREDSFEAKSEKWQESEKGESFQEKTELLSELLYELDGIANEIFEEN